MPLDRKKTLAFDVETGSQYDNKFALQPFRAMYHAADVTSYATAMYDAHGKITGKAKNQPTREDLYQLLTYCATNDIAIVGWNVSFDAAWLCGYGLANEVAKVKWLDAMLLLQHLEREPEYNVQRTKKQSFGLKPTVARFFPKYANYDAGVDFFDNSPAAVAKRLQYNKMDAIFTLRLAEMFYNKLEKLAPQTLRNALIEASAIVPIAQSIVEGLHIDTDHARDLQSRLAAKQEELGALLEEHGLTDTILASPKQLSAKLFNEWRLPVLVETPKGGPSTDKVALHMLGAHDDRVAHIREYREAANNRTKFVDKILDSVAYNEDGRTRPWPRIYGTYTGRVTFNSSQGRGKEQVQTGFALHQMKRSPDFRKTVIAPPGYVLCEWDAAGQEYRWMAIESGDTTMLQLCEPGQDPHAYMGAQIGHRDYFELILQTHAGDKEAKNVRQLGKVGNLSCVAADTEVLTPAGPRRIVDITASDLIWDGVEFVAHEGVVFNGYRKTITYQGLTATPDHQVLCQGQWTDFGRAASEGRHIDTAVWPVDDLVRSTVRGQLSGQSTLSMRVREGVRRGARVAGEWTQHAVSELRKQSVRSPSRQAGGRESCGSAAAEAGERYAAEVSEPPRFELPQLRRAWDRVSLWLRKGVRELGETALATSYIFGDRHRPRRQQRSLRAGELAFSHSQPQFTQQTNYSNGFVGRQTTPSAGMGAKPLFDNCCGAVSGQGADWRTNNCARMESGSSEAQKLAGDESKVAVYDILNCGPRNRFVANGLIVHNCQYRIGVKKLWITANVQFGMPITNEEAQTILDVYHQTYPGVKQYWTRQIHKCRTSGYAETLAGRRVQLKGSWINRQTAWQLESTAVNFPIQGIGADQKYLAIKILQNYLTKYGGRFYFELHDGLYAILPERTAEQAARAIQRALNKLPYQKAWGFTPPIPLPWDLKMGPSWGEMEEVRDD